MLVLSISHKIYDYSQFIPLYSILIFDYAISFNIISSLFLPSNSSTKTSFSIFQLVVQTVKLLVAKHLIEM
jgi:hypothetical protein